MKPVFVCLLSLLVFIGCDGLINDDSKNFDEWMSCSENKVETDGDLAWVDFDVTTTETPIPGDVLTLCMRLHNNPDYINSTPEDLEITITTTLRVFIEDINAETDTIGKIGPEDWFVGEFTVPALSDGEYHMILCEVKIPNTGHFSDSNGSEADSKSVSFSVYGLLDAPNCLMERDEYNNLIKASINKKTDELDVTNPKLPNLQVRFLKKSPTLPMLDTGGEYETEWEIINSGLGAAIHDFDLSIFLGEDECTIHQNIAEKRITKTISGSSKMKVKIPVKLPYVTWRENGWTLFSYTEKYDPADGDILYTRELPPSGPRGYDFTVYPCIESQSQLIAVVDSDSDNEVLETNEDDNCSGFFGMYGNGELESRSYPTGDLDIELVELRAENYVYSGSITTNAFDISIRYNADIQYADNCSFGYYFSKNDEAQFGDFFIQRYWVQIQPGHNILLYPFGINFVWRPSPLPEPGTYRMVLMMDDIFKFGEPDRTNNFKVSEGTITVK